MLSEFFYPSRRLGIDARRLAIPSLRSLHRRTKCGVYHQPEGLDIITHRRAFLCGLMIYNTSC